MTLIPDDEISKLNLSLKKWSAKVPEIKKSLIDQTLRKVGDTGDSAPEAIPQFSPQDVIEIRLDVARTLARTGNVSGIEAARLTGLAPSSGPLSEDLLDSAKKFNIPLTKAELPESKSTVNLERVPDLLSKQIDKNFKQIEK